MKDLIEQVKMVNGFLPVDLDTAGAATDFISLSHYDELTFILTLATGTVASAITLTESDDADGTTTATLGFSYMWAAEAIGTTNSDTYTKTAVTTNTFDTAALGDSKYLIRVRARDLTDGKSFVRLNASDPGATVLAECTVILGAPRYGQAALPSALTADGS
jgi:hypothetical protein